jgi:hypothetical protein
MLYTSPWSRFELTTSVLIGTDCIGSCKYNYHTITTTTAPESVLNRLKTLSVCLPSSFFLCVWTTATWPPESNIQDECSFSVKQYKNISPLDGFITGKIIYNYHSIHICKFFTGKIIYSYHSIHICRFITGKYIILIYWWWIKPVINLQMWA